MGCAQSVAPDANSKSKKAKSLRKPGTGQCAHSSSEDGGTSVAIPGDTEAIKGTTAPRTRFCPLTMADERKKLRASLAALNRETRRRSSMMAGGKAPLAAIRSKPALQPMAGVVNSADSTPKRRMSVGTSSIPPLAKDLSLGSGKLLRQQHGNTGGGALQLQAEVAEMSLLSILSNATLAKAFVRFLLHRAGASLLIW